MPSRPSIDAKVAALRARSALNPSPDTVLDPAFASGDFFDRRDLVQVKYEMLRRVRVDGWSVARAAATFGCSRPTYYAAQTAFDRDGLPGLLAQKRGPKHPRKLTDEVLAFIRALQAKEGALDAAGLAARVEAHFGLSVHPRSIERALVRVTKKVR